MAAMTGVDEPRTFVRLDKADFQFCSAHFCVFPGSREQLHGHNYRVYVELSGPVDDLGYVAEFGWIKSLIRELVATLDHRVLIAEGCPALEVTGGDGQVRVGWQSDWWSFPENDVVRLPLRNTTAELLATYLWAEIRTQIYGKVGPGVLRVEVEETPGQRAGIARQLSPA